jgi:hypothetical protein
MYNVVSFQSVVRTSDVRVSNRVNKSEVTLKTFPTVYNDLIGEVSTGNWTEIDEDETEQDHPPHSVNANFDKMII